MTISERCRARCAIGFVAWLAVALACHAAAAHAAETRWGGVLGVGFAATRAPGAFRWNFDSTRDSALAVLRVGATSGPLHGFASFAATPGAARDADTPAFRIREAALTAAWHTAADSAGLVLFAHEPGRVWLDLPLSVPVDAAHLGGGSITGLRGDAAWQDWKATVLALRSSASASGDSVDDAPRAWVTRLRRDLGTAGAFRIGATWSRDLPVVSAGDNAPGDVVTFDARAHTHGVVASVEYAQSRRTDPVVTPVVPAAGTAPVHVATPGPWTNALPERGALRLELRASAIPAGHFGTFGVAPAYRAIGARYFDRLAAGERDLDATARGFEGPHAEVWFAPRAWPAWVRQVYERRREFADADRRTWLQATEIQAWLTDRLRSRAFYVQRDLRIFDRPAHAHQDDLIGEVVAEDGAARVRAQAGWIDLNAPGERSVVMLETTARIAGRVQLVSRLAGASRGSGARRSAYMGLRYWHLPEFELVLEYGATTVGDLSEPALDADFSAVGTQLDRVRLHFRGWF
jgi:hypothetical protein